MRGECVCVVINLKSTRAVDSPRPSQATSVKSEKPLQYVTVDRRFVETVHPITMRSPPWVPISSKRIRRQSRLGACAQSHEYSLKYSESVMRSESPCCIVHNECKPIRE